MNEIKYAVSILGSYNAVGRVCGVSGKAVMKWAERGKLPRTEATGETQYSEKLSQADPRIDKQKLISTVVNQPASAARNPNKPTQQKEKKCTETQQK